MSWFDTGFDETLHQDPADEPDYSDLIPEPEGFRKEFSDGSSIIIFEFDDPVVEHGGTARKVAKHIEQYELDREQSIKYLSQCE
jgi:hypothetical protein